MLLLYVWYHSTGEGERSDLLGTLCVFVCARVKRKHPVRMCVCIWGILHSWVHAFVCVCVCCATGPWGHIWLQYSGGAKAAVRSSHTPWLSLSIIGMCVCWVQLICWSEYDISEAFTALLEMADWLTAEQMWHPKATKTGRAVFKLRWLLLQTLSSVNNNNGNNIKNYLKKNE